MLVLVHKRDSQRRMPHTWYLGMRNSIDSSFSFDMFRNFLSMEVLIQLLSYYYFNINHRTRIIVPHSHPPKFILRRAHWVFIKTDFLAELICRFFPNKPTRFFCNFEYEARFWRFVFERVNFFVFDKKPFVFICRFYM